MSKLSVIAYLKEYLCRKNNWTQSTQVTIAFGNSYKTVSTDSLRK